MEPVTRETNSHVTHRKSNSKSRGKIRAKGVGNFFSFSKKMIILNYLETSRKPERLFGERDLERNINYDLLKK